MRRAFLLVASVLVAAACSSGGDAPCTLLAVGAQCTNDTDCCTGNCQLEGDTAACQTMPKTPPFCVLGGSFCTQDRNCCSDICQNGTCFDTGAACLSLGSSCIQNDSCCSNDCISDGKGHTECAPQPQPDGGVSCGLPGTPCSTPGDDPGECCFGLCGIDLLCENGGGGGGGGGNCGQAGSYCRYGSECCSGQCEQLSSTGSCH